MDVSELCLYSGLGHAVEHEYLILEVNTVGFDKLDKARAMR